MQGALRRATVAAGLATLWFAPAVAAATAPTQASITGTISPAVSSTSGKLRSVALAITTHFQTIPAGGQPATVSQAVIYFGHIEVPLCPPGAIVPLQGVFSFIGAPTQTVNSGIVCGEPPPS